MATFEKTNVTVRQEVEPIALNAKQQEDDHIGWLKWVRVTATQELAKIARQPVADSEIPWKEKTFMGRDYKAVKLPPQGNRFHRLLTQPRFQRYNRHIAFVFLVNLVTLAFAILSWGWFSTGKINLAAISNVMLANFALAILIRQQRVINFLFKLTIRLPRRLPLRVRWFAAKVYHFGGFHVGGAIAGTVWFAILLGALAYHVYQGLPGASVALVIMSLWLLVLLIAIMYYATPHVRRTQHDQFERIHRFGGWTALALFWVQTLMFVDLNSGNQSLVVALLASPAFWVLAVLTLSVALPWLQLRRVPIHITKPSPHVALVSLDYGVKPIPGSTIALSRNPLREWHPFANIPTPGEDGCRLAISRAGDWTSQFIDDMPSHIWVKGVPISGMATIAPLFDRIVWIATGSGIGPVLPHLLTNERCAKLIWSTPDPYVTYGYDLVKEIRSVQPDAMIWNTNTDGRPNLVKLAYKAVQATDAEAVIIISNQKLTQQVVYHMESRGIPAFGAIWDS